MTQSLWDGVDRARLAALTAAERTMCPATTEADVDHHDAAFGEALDALLG